MGIPLLQGRIFNNFDRADTPLVVLINETLARFYWPNEDPVGEKIEVGSFGPPMVREIVGVVRDVRHGGLDSEPRPEVYIPHSQNPSGSMTFVARSDYASTILLSTMKHSIWRIREDLAFAREMTIEEIIGDSLRGRHFNLLLVSAFAVISVILVAVGVSGIIGFSTSQRTHEIGMRMALGARRRDIVLMVVREELGMVVVGLVIGLVSAVPLTRALTGFFYGISPADPLTFAFVAAMLIVLGLSAIYVPARRASGVQPAKALRCV